MAQIWNADVSICTYLLKWWSVWVENHWNHCSDIIEQSELWYWKKKVNFISTFWPDFPPLNLFLSGYIQEECVIPCPFDCKLSDWSSWGSCSSSCGIGVRIRSKWLKEKPYNGGRPCPKLDLKNQVKCLKQQQQHGAKNYPLDNFLLKSESLSCCK